MEVLEWHSSVTAQYAIKLHTCGEWKLPCLFSITWRLIYTWNKYCFCKLVEMLARSEGQWCYLLSVQAKFVEVWLDITQQLMWYMWWKFYTSAWQLERLHMVSQRVILECYNPWHLHILHRSNTVPQAGASCVYIPDAKVMIQDQVSAWGHRMYSPVTEEVLFPLDTCLLISETV